jgi:hypothetical protein
MYIVGLGSAEAVSKLKITRFQGTALPLQRCREADIERSNKPLFALSRNGVRFDTLWGKTCRWVDSSKFVTIPVHIDSPLKIHSRVPICR